MNNFDPVHIAAADPQGSTAWWLKRVADLPFTWQQVDKTNKTEVLGNLKKIGAKHVFVDTPGNLEDEYLLAAALEHADDVIMPLPPEPLAFDPLKRTINQVIVPRDLPYKVVISNWDPRDGIAERDDAIAYVDANGWPRTKTTVRKYKVHARASLEGRIVTQYPRNRVALEARQDFFKLAMELGLSDHNDPEPRVHVVANQKGGVGKTTTTVGLAAVIFEVLAEAA